MARRKVGERDVTKLLYQLCSIYSNNQDHASMMFKMSLSVLGSCLASSVVVDEKRLTERVQKKLVQQGRETDGVLFKELYQRLCNHQNPASIFQFPDFEASYRTLSLAAGVDTQSMLIRTVLCEDAVVDVPSIPFMTCAVSMNERVASDDSVHTHIVNSLRERPSLLCFFFFLMTSSRHMNSSYTQASLLLDSLGLPFCVPSDSEHSLSSSQRTGHPHPPTTPGGVCSPAVMSSQSSGLGSSLGSSCVSESTLVAGSKSYASSVSAASARFSTPYASTPALSGHLPPRPSSSTSHKEAWVSDATHPVRLDSTQNLTPAATRKDNEVSEADLVHDLLYVFQSIDGQYLHYRHKDGGYKLKPQVCAGAPVREMCYKLAELGWLHRKVKHFIDKQDLSRGLVIQSFCSALKLELTEYYRLVAVLEAQVQEGDGVGGSVGGLTLKRVLVWTHEPKQRLQILAALVDTCKHVKGGALVSTLHQCSEHGDPAVRKLLLHLLAQVYLPLLRVLQCWVCEGEIEDHSLEFFVACDDSTRPEKLWRSKYSLRRSMLPRFISPALAQKVMTIGKSINFLRHLCDDHAALGEAARRSWKCLGQQPETPKRPSFHPTGSRGLSSNVYSFTSMTGPALSAVVDSTYQETSKHLLHILHSKFNLMEHMKALRRYLLLGQGDFIRHLMDLLAPELDKPASSLYLHNLTGTLEAAVRATTAQYDWSESLQRLDVRTLDLSPGDVGWDVFSLHYHVDGPISTVFTGVAMLKYLRVFNFLWRGKRMEYCLASMWREQTSHSRLLHQIPGLGGVLHQSQLLLSCMVHFISQLQYYINFEVLECSWAGLLAKVEKAEDLDQVIQAHDHFLDHVTRQCLLDDTSQTLLTQLRAIYDLIIQFQHTQATMLGACLQELGRREALDASRDKLAAQKVWRVTEVEEVIERERREEFTQQVRSFHADITVLQDSFKVLIGELMEDLRRSLEQSLQFLHFRLDFNQFYTLTLGTLSNTSFY